MNGVFYERDGDAFVATPLTRGPWDVRFQHGGPPAALLAGALERFGDDHGDFVVARLSFELLRPVPIAALTVRVSLDRPGRRVQRLSAALLADDQIVLTATGLRMRRTSLSLPAPPTLAPWPDPASLPRYVFPFFLTDVGYHQAVDLRITHGAWGRTPVGFWTRPLVPLVEGRTSSALERLVTLADAQSGMGVPLDPMRFTFVNPDLSLFLERPPDGEWLGFDIRSGASAVGAGLSESALRDRHGLVGRSAQTLLVRPRPPQTA